MENALRRIGGFEIVDTAGDRPGDRAADAAGEVPGDRTADAAGDRPGDRAADTAGDVPEDRTVDAAGDRPGDRAADKPVKYTGRVGIQPVIGMETPWRYRNKAQYPVASVRTAEGSVRTEAGFYAGRTHSLIPVRDCVLTGQANQVDAGPSASRAGNHLHPAFPKAQGAQNDLRALHLFHRVAGEGHPDGVADAL